MSSQDSEGPAAAQCILQGQEERAIPHRINNVSEDAEDCSKNTECGPVLCDIEVLSAPLQQPQEPSETAVAESRQAAGPQGSQTGKPPHRPPANPYTRDQLAHHRLQRQQDSSWEVEQVIISIDLGLFSVPGKLLELWAPQAEPRRSES